MLVETKFLFTFLISRFLRRKFYRETYGARIRGFFTTFFLVPLSFCTSTLCLTFQL